MAERLSRELIQQLEARTASEIAVIVALKGSGFVNEGDPDHPTETMIGWAAFLVEISKRTFFDNYDNEQVHAKARMVNDLVDLTRKKERTGGFSVKLRMEEVILHARKKALLIITGELDPHYILELDSKVEYPEGDGYLSVDWTRDWSRSRPEMSESPYESYKRMGGFGSD